MTGQGDWERYGRALHRAMAEALEELPEEARPHALETCAPFLLCCNRCYSVLGRTAEVATIVSAG